jgi:hypothetical protein
MDPYAVGGEATVGNISLRCRAHNAFEAEVWFGSREPASNSDRTEFTTVYERSRSTQEAANSSTAIRTPAIGVRNQ